MLTILGIVVLLTFIGMILETMLKSLELEQDTYNDNCQCPQCQAELQRREQRREQRAMWETTYNRE